MIVFAILFAACFYGIEKQKNAPRRETIIQTSAEKTTFVHSWGACLFGKSFSTRSGVGSQPHSRADSQMTADAFTFLGNQYIVSKRTTCKQIINVKGPWPSGRKTFTHGYTKVSEHLEHDESAQHMLERVEKDLAAFEVRRPLYGVPSQ